MDDYDGAMKHIEAHEATKISYVKVGNNNKKLIVSFSAYKIDAQDSFFERKQSLMRLKYKRNDFDVLFVRNKNNWYIGGLTGIGRNINHTIAFLKKEFIKYDNILCTGYSMGGYASLLFGSLLNVTEVIAIEPQTDLEYIANNKATSSMKKADWIRIRKKNYPVAWSRYNKIKKILSNQVIYNVWFNENIGGISDNIFHGDYHYDQIKDFTNVNRFESQRDIIPLMERFLGE